MGKNNIHSVEIAGIKRELPLFAVNENLKIALFNILSDTEVVVAAARALVEKLPKEVEVLVTPEVKSVPLTFEMSRISGLPYVVTRKIRKPYMENAMSAEVVSITTGKPQTLWLDGKDKELIKGAKVALIDDVVSTGSTFQGLRKLMSKAGAKVEAEAVVFTEGDDDQWQDVISLGHLPLFKE
jgi:adenine phosphoribosyltransferase